jgi:hypothetical protein
LLFGGVEDVLVVLTVETYPGGQVDFVGGHGREGLRADKAVLPALW